jgi:HNH endonuclease
VERNSGFPCYEISTLGRVRRIVPGRLVEAGYMKRVGKNPNGYFQVSLSNPGERSKVRCIHFLMCTTFHGPKPTPKHHVAHYDGNKLNNHPSNLRWATAKENHADTIRLGAKRCPQGEESALHKLTAADVLEIKQAVRDGARNCDLARTYGVIPATISAIRCGKSWKHLVLEDQND